MATQNDALGATWSLITKAAREVEASGLNASTKAAAVRDIAFAYRLAAGGPQPGGIPVKD